MKMIARMVGLFLLLVGQAYAAGVNGGGVGLHGSANLLPIVTGVGGAANAAWGGANGNSALELGSHNAALFDNGSAGYLLLNAYWDNDNGDFYRSNTGYAAGINFIRSSGRINIDIQPTGSAGTATSLFSTPMLALYSDGTLHSGKSCATAYARATPNECIWNATDAPSSNITANTCQEVDAPSASTVWELIKFHVSAVSAGVAATSRYAFIDVYSDSGCTTGTMGLAVSRSDAYEYTAVTGSKSLATTTNDWLVYLPTPGQKIYLHFLRDAGNNSFAAYLIKAYGE